jgi:hypothetical protein
MTLTVQNLTILLLTGAVLTALLTPHVGIYFESRHMESGEAGLVEFPCGTFLAFARFPLTRTRRAV